MDGLKHLLHNMPLLRRENYLLSRATDKHYDSHGNVEKYDFSICITGDVAACVIEESNHVNNILLVDEREKFTGKCQLVGVEREKTRVAEVHYETLAHKPRAVIDKLHYT